jgi:geranylgeranyl pyrophosphate synthase
MVDESFPPFFEEQKLRVDRSLDNLLPPADKNRLAEAMRYTVLGGGKRIRGVLVLEAYRLGSKSRPELAESLSGIIELLHAYTLIHDDLPAMDDDDTRRGQPASHKQFDEATAILTGNSLQSLAFRSLSELDVSEGELRTLGAILSDAMGYEGVLQGQVWDLDLENTEPTEETILEMYEKKTGYLIGCALEVGGVAGGLKVETRGRLRTCGRKLGKAFQIQDDLLEETGTSDQLGKNTKSDESRKKSTLVDRVGEAAARDRANELVEDGRRLLDEISQETERLSRLAAFLIERNY